MSTAARIPPRTTGGRTPVFPEYARVRHTIALLLLIFITVFLPSLSSGAPPSSVVVGRGVSPAATAENSQRKLLVDPQGRLLLAYVRPAGDVDQVFLAESADGGRTWRSTQMTQAPRPARLPSLALFPDNSVHLVWTEYAPIGVVLYRERRGGRWTAPVGLSQLGVYAGVPVVAPRGGQPHVLWYGILPERPTVRTRHGSIYEIVFTRRAAAAWSPPVSISPGIPDSINPALDTGAGSRLHAAWYQFDSRVYQIRYAQFDGRWSPPRNVTSGPAEHTRVALAADGADVHLVWEEQGARRQIMYLRLAERPQPLATGPVHDPVVAAAGGRVVAAWSEDQAIILLQVRPSGESLRLGAGSGPMVALRGNVAYVAWTSADPVPVLRFTAVPLR